MWAFRLSSPKIKLIQNISQSREIKFGNIIEKLITKYIKKLGFQILPNDISTKDLEHTLKADLLFKVNDKKIYLVEMKIRDDHDSAKNKDNF